VAVFARFAPTDGKQAQWFVKQALDIGLMGVICQRNRTTEHGVVGVRNMRYPQKKTSKYPEHSLDCAAMLRETPFGGGAFPTRNTSGGRSLAAKSRRDLLAIMMMKQPRALKNADAIASVPGVGCNFRWCGPTCPVSRSGTRLARIGAGLPNDPPGLLAHNVLVASLP